MSRLEVVPPPVVGPGLFRWLSDVRAAMGLEAARAPALENGWINFGAGHAVAAYWKQGGEVKLTGTLTGGFSGVAFFTLPVGFRPPSKAVFNQAGSAGPVRVDVLANGQVLISDASFPTWVALDGISFRTR